MGTDAIHPDVRIGHVHGRPILKDDRIDVRRLLPGAAGPPED